MRKLIVAILILFSVQASAQYNFPSLDSLRRYINRFITNSAINAFTDYRLNTALNGMLRFIDSAGGGSTAGIDSVWALNDSTLRVRKGLALYSVVIKGGATPVPTLQQVIDAGYAISAANDSIVAEANNTFGLYGRNNTVLNFQSTGNSTSFGHLRLNNDGFILRQRNLSTGNYKGLSGSSASNSGLLIFDQGDLTGLGYEANYRTNGLANFGARWIPDIGAVRQEISDSLGGASSTLTDMYIGVGNSSNQLSGHNHLLYDYTDRILRINPANTFAGDDQYGLIIGKRKMLLQDTTNNGASFIEFGKSYAGAGNTQVRGVGGLIGTREMVWGVNLDYTNDAHDQYDNTINTNYTAMNENYWAIQAFKAGGDWVANGRVVFRIDNINSPGGDPWGSQTTTNRLLVADPATGGYQNDGRALKIEVSTARAEFAGVGGVDFPDSVQVLIGPVNDGTTPDFGIQNTTGNTVATMMNEVNDGSTNRWRMLKKRGSSFNLSGGDVIFDIQAQTLCSYQMVANSMGSVFSSFKLPEHRWTTSDESANDIERLRIGWNGTVMVNSNSSDLSVRNRRLFVNGSVGIAKDSVPTVSSITSQYVMLIDTASGSDSNQIKRIALADLVNAESASYTPTITSVTNVAGTTLKSARYQRHGAFMDVWVYVTIDPTSVGSTEIAISFPIASAVSTNDVFGTATCSVIAQGGIVTTDVSNSRATYIFTATDTGAQDHVLHFTVPIILP